MNLRLLFTLFFSFSFIALSADEKKEAPKEDLDFYAEVIDSSSGNKLSSGQLIFSPQKEPDRRKAFNIGKDGRVHFPKTEFGNETYWAFKHPDYVNQGGCHLVMKRFDKDSPFVIQAEKGTALKGKTVDPKGKPVAGVKVSLGRDVLAANKSQSHFYKGLDEIKSDEKGEFEIAHFGKGKFSVYASNKDWVVKETLKLEHPAEELTMVELAPSTNISFKVVDREGKDIDHAKISWYQNIEEVDKYDSDDAKLKGSLSTGNTHPTSIQLSVDRGLQFKVTGTNIVSKELLNQTVKAGETVTFEVIRKAKIEGKVIDQVSHKNLKGASIAFKYPGNRYFTGKERKVQSSKKGEYHVYMEKEGPVDATVSMQGYLRQKLNDIEVKEAGGVTTLDFQLEKGESGEFKFITRYLGEEEVLSKTALSYQLFYVDGGKGKSFSARTNEEGVYKLEGWKEGDQVIFKLKGYSSKMISLAPMTEVSIVELESTGQVEVLVLNENDEPIKNATFQLENLGKEFFKEKEAWSKVKYSKSRNAYVVEDLSSAGMYRVKAKAKKYYESMFQSVVIRSGEVSQVTYKLEPADEVKIKVVVEEGDLEEKISLRQKTMVGRSSTIDTVNVDANSGLFIHTLKDKEKRRFQVTMKGYAPSAEFNYVEEEGHVHEVRLEKGLSFGGQVVNQEGEGLGGARVTIHNANYQDQHFYKSEKVSSQGYFKIEGIKAGTFKVSVKLKGYANYKKDFTLEESIEGEVLALKRGGTIRGYVVNEQYERVKGVDVVIMNNGGYNFFNKYYDYGQNSTQRVNTEGEFEYTDLAVGSYRIDIKTKAGVGKSEVIELKEDEVLEGVVIELKEGLSIVGKVIDEEDNPVENLNMRAYKMQEGGQQKECKSGAEGKFELKGLDEGTYTINLKDKDYELSTKNYYGQTAFAAGKKDVVLKVRKGKPIACKVITPDEKEISHYDVFIRRSDGNENRLKLHQQNGMEFSFLNSKVGRNNGNEFEVVVKAEGYNPGVSAKISKDHEGLVEIELKPERTLTLSIRDRNYNPLADVQVKYKLEQRFNRHFYGNHKIYMSDKMGDVKIAGVASGVYDFRLSKAGYAVEVLSLEVDENRSEPYDVSIGKGGTVQGYVLNVDGLGLKDQVVKLRSNEPNNFSDQFQATTNEDGFYKIVHVTRGSYRIYKSEKNQRMDFLGAQQNESVIDVEDDKVIEFNLEEESEEGKGKIIGRVEADGDYLGAVLMGLGGATRLQAQTQIANKAFEMRAIEPGTYMLMVSGMRGNFLRKEVEVKAGETLTVVFEAPKMSIVAKVQNSAGEPIHMAQAMLMKTGGVFTDPSSAMDSMGAFAMVQNGDLSLAVQKPGNYTLTITPMAGFGGGGQGGSFKKLEISLSEGEQKDLGIIVLDEGQEFRGVVQDANALPIERARMYVMSNNIPMMNNNVRSDENGAFVMKNAPEFPFTLVVSARGFSTTSIEVHANDQIVVLEKGGSLKVLLKGKRVSGRSLRLVGEGADAQSFNVMRGGMIMTNRNGSYNFKSLRPGEYQVKVLPSAKDEKELLSGRVYVSAESEAQVAIELNDE